MGSMSRTAEERFIWMAALLILFDCYAFERMNNWGAPLAIFRLEVIVVVVIAQRCGVQDITLLLDRVLQLWRPRGTRPDLE